MEIIKNKKRYTLPDEKTDAAFVGEPAVCMTRIDDLHNLLVNRVMTIQNPETLQSLLVYINKTIFNKQDSFEEEWKRSISIEDFRMQCKNKLKKMYE